MLCVDHFGKSLLGHSECQFLMSNDETGSPKLCYAENATISPNKASFPDGYF